MDPSIRSATAADVDSIVELWAIAAGPSRSPGTGDDARRLLDRDPHALVVAELAHGDQSQIVGTLIIGWDGWRHHLYRMAVDPRHRRSGIAHRLVAEARHRVVVQGGSRIDAMVDTANGGGIAFWESEGFVLDRADARWSLVLGSPRSSS